jgi:hypothetical protein
MSRACFFVPTALLFGTLGVVLWGSASAQDKAKDNHSAAKVIWEYKMVIMSLRGDTEAAFNEVGKDGWELVAIKPAEPSMSPQAYFKRAKRDSIKKQADAPKNDPSD